MTVNHQYTYGADTYNGASEIVFAPTWVPTVIKEGLYNQPVRFVRRGSLVVASGLQFLDSSITGNTILAVLPAGLRPTKTVTFSGYSQNNDHRVFNVQPNGDLYCNTDQLNSYFWLDGTYWV